MRDLFLLFLGIMAVSAIYLIVARQEIAREQTATDEMWHRGIGHYTPRVARGHQHHQPNQSNQKGAGETEVSPDAPERCEAPVMVRRTLEDYSTGRGNSNRSQG